MTTQEAAALVQIEGVIEEEICMELPIVSKYLTKIVTNLKTKGGHPLKVWALQFVIDTVIPAAQTELKCTEGK